jgi:hypothetical protein
MRMDFLVAGAFVLGPTLAVARAPANYPVSLSTIAQADTTPPAMTPNGPNPNPNVTPAMVKAQDDASVVGSSAWWKTHATADGRPK